MNGCGFSLLVGLLLMGLLVFASWIRTPHHSSPEWHAAMQQTLAEVDGFRPSETPGR